MFLAAPALAQQTYYSIFSYDNVIPEVVINENSVALQADLYPEWYHSNSPVLDLRWVREHDSSLLAFWHSQGDTILHILTELAGIEWREPRLEIRLLRYFPSPGTSDPLIITMGGMKKGELTEAAPTGKVQQFNLVFRLAGRMLDQTSSADDSIFMGIAHHPLMRHSPYRRDNLAMLLAYETCRSVIGLDSTEAALASACWQRYAVGSEILKRHFLNHWILTPDQPLAYWLAREPYGSHLVAITRPPRPERRTTTEGVKFIEGLPLTGRLGFSVSIDENGYLMVDTIDTYRLAYACGLRVGDRILTANNARVRNHRKLVEKIIETLDQGGATLQVLRDDAHISVIIQPMVLPVYEDYFDIDRMLPPDQDPSARDSIPVDSLE